ncbi:hypothetical protein L1987_06513 [Smallanthus sonchifolius]|uniref:Uncharacterized protein n=1 Tax=Smallanthus sonchifolius TaxID=185202 RepID=A0ACB9JYJ2_9ASTR|nr:hypothetical protein L1987_06513 [Smallanthus sonchifolius]
MISQTQAHCLPIKAPPSWSLMRNPALAPLEVYFPHCCSTITMRSPTASRLPCMNMKSVCSQASAIRCLVQGRHPCSSCFSPRLNPSSGMCSMKTLRHLVISVLKSSASSTLPHHKHF